MYFSDAPATTGMPSFAKTCEPGSKGDPAMEHYGIYRHIYP
jgi:hypothetical protein